MCNSEAVYLDPEHDSPLCKTHAETNEYIRTQLKGKESMKYKVLE